MESISTRMKGRSAGYSLGSHRFFVHFNRRFVCNHKAFSGDALPRPFALAVLIWITATYGFAENSHFWTYYENTLKHAVAEQDWYQAKKALYHLKSYDEQRWKKSNFAMTAAKIELGRNNPASAYQWYRDAAEEHPRTKLETAKLLLDMSHPEEALTILTAGSAEFRGEGKWERFSLYYQALEAMNDLENATRIAGNLTHKRTPVLYRLPAYLALSRLHYKMGDTKKGRRHAEKLQSDYPYSDEAMSAVFLQHQYESESYLEESDNLKRMAMASFRNRNFTMSDSLFQQLTHADHPLKYREQAQYYLAYAQLKQGNWRHAESAMAELVKTLHSKELRGMAAYQQARCLLMDDRPKEVVSLCENMSNLNIPKTWLRDSQKLRILALRKLDDYDAFLQFGGQLRSYYRHQSLETFFQRNGVIWSLERGKPDTAMAYLSRYMNTRPTGRLRDEAFIWKGIIQQSQGNDRDAVQSWLEVAVNDPNHYFGLIARELILENPEKAYFRKSFEKAALSRSKNKKREALLSLYFLSDDANEKAALKQKLAAFWQAPDHDDPTQYAYNQETQSFIEAGRFDLAAQNLGRRTLGSGNYHFFSAYWYEKAGLWHNAVSHAEILAARVPNWVPTEWLPEDLQKLLFPIGFFETVQGKAAQAGVDPYLMLSVIREESRFNERAKSAAGARGLMQFIPSTALGMAKVADIHRDYHPDKLYEAETAITLGATYLETLLNRFQGKCVYSVAAYNAGEETVDRWRFMCTGDDSLRFVWDVTYTETKNYCQKVLRAYHHYTRLYTQKDARPEPVMLSLLDL